jgi:hypothetical protein
MNLSVGSEYKPAARVHALDTRRLVSHVAPSHHIDKHIEFPKLPVNDDDS